MGKTSYSDWWFGTFFIFHVIYGMSSSQLTFTPWKILHRSPCLEATPKWDGFFGPKKEGTERCMASPNPLKRRPGDFFFSKRWRL